MGVDLFEHLLQMQLRRLLLRKTPQVVFAPPAALCHDEQRCEEQYRNDGREDRIEMEIVDVLLDGQPGNADARHPAAASELQGIVDAFLIDPEILRDGVGDGLPPRGQYFPECLEPR